MSSRAGDDSVIALWSARLARPRFRYAPIVRAGPFYKTAGMVGLAPGTGALAEGGAGPETRCILANLLNALPDFALSLAELMSVTIYTTDFARFAEINDAWEEVFTDGARLPARTVAGVSALPLGATVEMEFWFYRRDDEVTPGGAP